MPRNFLTLILFLFITTVSHAGLVDQWCANDLIALDNGDAVGAWNSLSNRLSTAPVDSQPTFKKAATVSGASAVHFSGNLMNVASSPAAALNAFSMAVVFKVDQLGADVGSGWSTKSGIVDANEAGVTSDWGFAVRESGYICFGTGGDNTVYLDNQPTYPSIVDGKYHVVVCTWGAGAQTMYLDSLPSKTQTGVSTVARNNAGISFGGIHTGEANQRFVGDLVEVQFYNSALTATEATSLITHLSDQFFTNHLPAVLSFTPSTNTIYVGVPLTLRWAVSNATTVSIDNGVGNLGALSGSVQVTPSVSTIYTLTASNSSGISTAAISITVDPGIPIAEPQSISVFKNTSRTITLSGHDPQSSPLTFVLAQLPQHGTLTGVAPNVVYKPQSNFVGSDFFTFKANDGAYDSPPASIIIQVDEASLPPHGLFLSTTDLNASATPGAFLAALRAVDVNALDTHSFSLVPGIGSDNNSLFSISGNRLLAGGGFPVGPGTNLSFRMRATDSSGLFFEQVFALKAKAPNLGVVINEIHYNPPDNTVREEFIELFNPSNGPVNLSLWRLRGGIDYVFSNGVSIAAGGYLVVASVPATIQSRYGVTALGPWSGNLSSDGEQIDLRDAGGNVIDEVDYKSEFPWPIAANGEGSSMELINPSLDNNLGSSWASSLSPALPSPGAPSRVLAINPAPNIRQVSHFPQTPASTNQVTVTAKVTDPQGVASVILKYQVVTPGNFIPAFFPWTVAQLYSYPTTEPPVNPAFENATNWVSTSMHDDGLNGDELAGDDIYTVVLPVRPNRTLVRYRITPTDNLGAARRAPMEDDASLNFAYFVYDGIPAYGGTSATNLETLPIYFTITRDADYSACTAYSSPQITQGSEARFTFNWPAAMVYDGEVYDHIRYRLRGANGRYQNGKRNFRIRFNNGRLFAAKDEFGKAYARKWSHLNTAKGQSNRETVTFSLNENINYFLLNKVGVPSPFSHFFHWRMIRGAQEAPDLYNGDFYGLGWAQEDYDPAFLESHNLAKGNLYKLINASRSSDPYIDMQMQQRYQAAFAVTNGGDAVRIQNALLSPTSAYETDDWLQANVNYSNWYAYHAVCEAVRNYDTWPSANKNNAWYFDTNYTAANEFNGRFWTLPWDMTDTWGPSWNYGQDLAWNGIWGASSTLHTNMQRDYRNTMRELRDLFFQPDQINPVIDALAARGNALVAADLLRWSNCLPYNSSYISLARSGPGLSQGLAGYVKDMKEFMFTGGYRAWWISDQGSTVGSGGWITRLDTVATDANIPAKPTLSYVGQAGYPMNSLTFECLPFSDPQGASTFSAMEWRLAEVQDTNHPAADARVIPPLEYDAIWRSGALTNWSNRITIPGTFVQTNKIYRTRVRHMDNTARWSQWSAPVQFSVTPVDVVALLREGLRFSEIMYDPPVWSIYNGDDLEFLELQNTGTNSLDLGGLVFTAGITYTFPVGTTLKAGQRYLLGRNTAAIQAKYPGVTLQGIYSGKLDNGGETIRLSTPAGLTVLEVSYKDSPPWPVTADGLGWSLVLADPTSGIYRASTEPGGSPGLGDPASRISGILLNELLTHTDLPQLDSIELFNPTTNLVNLGGWFLSDDPAVPKKYRIPNDTMISPGGYRVFDASAFNQGPLAFALSSVGDDIYLFSGDATTNLTGYVHGTSFGASKNGVSFGRYVNSLGEEDFVPMAALTLGTNNSRPAIGPVVISEIMFQPPLIGTNENYDAEFIEFQNVTSTNVLLFSSAFPTNTYKLGNAVSYVFPTNVILSVASRLLVVGFDPQTNATALANFRSTYAVSNNISIFGPWSGHLDNSGETIELKLPDTPELDGSVPYVMVEKVAFRPTAPWPAGATGTGQSLQRAVLLAYANDPVNWFVAQSTAGTLSAQTSQDVDSDGIPDLWEQANGTDPYVADGSANPDGDSIDNYHEWLAGTDPRDAGSYLHFDPIAPSPSLVTLQFTAVAGHSYGVLATPVLDAKVWSTMTNIYAASTNRVISIKQPAEATMFYQLITPAQP